VIVVAGASGYIGKKIVPALLAKFPNAKIIALARSAQISHDPRVEWRACDLFSPREIELALPPHTDLALYLVHSMGPTAQLDQGSFADYDLLLADNFGRALQPLKIQQLIYLGGLIPDAAEISLHLRSRLEVEEIFREKNLPTTVFRAGLILGEGGSSFQILLKLVNRLPLMVCPHWTQTLTTPVDLQSVVDAISSAALDPTHLGKTYDLAACQPITYLEMMKQTARRLGKKRAFITVPFFTPTLSRLWVSLITNTPKGLVYPLIESLEHAMVARPENAFSAEKIHRTYEELLEQASVKTTPGPSLFSFQPQRKTVRSVQRLALPPGRDAAWIKDRYVQWLPHFLAPFLRVTTEADTVKFFPFFSSHAFLELELSRARSRPDRQLLYIKKGLLVGEENRGRLEFRTVLNNRFVLAAIHDFRPALPWAIYKFTQAKLHLLVMRAFGRDLIRHGVAIHNRPNP
jgi:uncharacterized protein YbjT (DUF2867 family)